MVRFRFTIRAARQVGRILKYISMTESLPHNTALHVTAIFQFSSLFVQRKLDFRSVLHQGCYRIPIIAIQIHYLCELADFGARAAQAPLDP